ncbi:MAG: MerR family transcriptional regulator [Acidobacteriota bacterium]
MGQNSIEIPDKPNFKIGEVCRLTDTQPYVLRFWESEFPTLAPQKSRSGQRIYQRRDIETVLQIKHLLYEESYTISGARKKLETVSAAQPAPSRGPAGRIAQTSAPRLRTASCGS